VDTTTRLSIGEYRIDFNQAVNNCAHIANQGKTGTGTKPVEAQGFAETAGDSTGTDKVRVFTFDKGGGSFDRSFHIAVFC
jgi:hypothetical protein